MKYLLMLLAFSIFFLACNDDESNGNDPSNFDVSNFYGHWQRMVVEFDDADFLASLHINKDNTFDFILEEDVEGHTNSSATFTLNENIMTVTNDSDCEVDGIYELSFKENMLVIEAKTDGCYGRKTAISGTWNKQVK